MTDPLVEAVRSELRAGPELWPECAKDIDVKPITIGRFATGQTPSPRVHTFFKIRDWLKQRRDTN